MPQYEYHVVPAPKKAGKIKGVKGTEARFAAELANLMNELGADGWEYQRTDTLPVEERQGLTGRVTTFQNMLVFRREINAVGDSPQVEHAAPEALPEPPSAPVLTFHKPQEPVAHPAPMLASREAPEGNPPSIRRPTADDFAAQ